MLNGPLLHPDILRSLARSGHHSKVLIADGNYPAATKRGGRCISPFFRAARARLASG